MKKKSGKKHHKQIDKSDNPAFWNVGSYPIKFFYSV